MKAIVYLQGSLGGRNSRDGAPLFMEPVAGRPLLGLLLDEVTASGCFERVVFVTSASTCDDPVVDYLEREWPAVGVERVGADSPHAFGDDARREQLLTAEDYAGVLSIDGFKAIAPRYVQDAGQTVFVLGVNDAPLCSRRFFAAAMPLARETAIFTTIRPGTTALCGFPMRGFDAISGHQRSLRVSEAAGARDRVERAVQEIRRERYLADDDEISAVHGWQRARVERYAPYRGGSLSHALRDYVGRHVEGTRREAFARETAGESVAVVSRAGLEMVRAVWSVPPSTDLTAAETWLGDFEQRTFHREAQRRFYPEYPSYLEVEPTSRCNLACPFCPQTKLTRPTSDMSYEAFAELVERAGDFVFLLNLSGYGEPTLHPRLFDLVRLAKSKGIPRVELETNGTTIDEAFLDAVFESGLDVLTINLDAVDASRSDEAEAVPFGSVYELVRRFLERRGARQRPFLVLQRVNMAVAGQDKRIQRDFALWYDVADAFVIKPFNTYRGSFPDKRVINFAPLERTGCRKLLASACVLSSGEAVMCEQCFDAQDPAQNGRRPVMLDASGENPYARRLAGELDLGNVSAFCTPCAQWYQQDVAWTTPKSNRLWFERAIASAAARLATDVLDAGEAVGRTRVPEIIRRSGDYGDEIHEACRGAVGKGRWKETRPSALPVAREPIGPSGSGAAELVEPVACAVGGRRLYVTDGGARRVAVYSSSGRFDRHFGETTEPFGRLPDLAVVDDEVLVADDAHVQRFTLEGKPLGVLAPDIGAPIGSIAAGRSGELLVAGSDGVLNVVEVASGEVVRTVSVPAWGKVFVSSSPSSGELFVSCVDSHDVLVYDLDGELVRRVGRNEVGRLASPVHTLRWGGGYAVSNWGWQEILILSTTFEYVGAVAAPGLRGSTAFDGERLYTILNGATPGCAVWETARVTSGV